jgi:hypothetical protein
MSLVNDSELVKLSPVRVVTFLQLCEALKEFAMNRSVALSLVALIFIGIPCQAQILKHLEQDLMGGQNQGQTQVQAQLVGNVNLPPGQYMMTNVQTGQGFYVVVQNGQMYLSGQQGTQQMMAPGQQGGMQRGTGGGFGNFLKNEFTPQQQQFPNQ